MTSVYLIVVPLLLGAAIVGEVAPRPGPAPGNGQDATSPGGSRLEKPRH
ncbi:hypothetical protein [Pseudonocardia alaniniphila]|uniref:Uncharacterized protein n=1 Tax=Pseudonocardia alaniniphila TaxID=75291 RepID=A0ABS9TUI1_9PSEU|nr:hypothetical protein [Pseudonocardia alaniniphila]MCH6172156.1 hypothetical protein [Pseudonocardia alaniniphila]